MTRFIILSVYMISFIFCFYGLSCIKYETFTNVRDPKKVWVLHLMLSFGLSYVVGQFVLAFTIYG